MKVGCVKEIKNNEFRVGMTPDNVKSYVNAGHDVYIEKGAGEGSIFKVWSLGSNCRMNTVNFR